MATIYREGSSEVKTGRMYKPGSMVFELYKRLEDERNARLLQEGPLLKIDLSDIVIEGDGVLLKGTSALSLNGMDFNAYFFPDTGGADRGVVGSAIDAIKSFYGRPSDEIESPVGNHLVYNVQIGTREFHDKYHDGSTTDGKRPIVRRMILSYDQDRYFRVKGIEELKREAEEYDEREAKEPAALQSP